MSVTFCSELRKGYSARPTSRRIATSPDAPAQLFRSPDKRIVSLTGTGSFGCDSFEAESTCMARIGYGSKTQLFSSLTRCDVVVVNWGYHDIYAIGCETVEDIHQGCHDYSCTPVLYACDRILEHRHFTGEGEDTFPGSGERRDSSKRPS